MANTQQPASTLASDLQKLITFAHPQERPLVSLGSELGSELDQREQTPALSEDILCVLNRKVNKKIGLESTNYTNKIKCKTDKTEVYVPFSFINHYYEAKGDFVFEDGKKEFEISHSYSKHIIRDNYT